MSQTHDEIRALRVMVEELRAEPVPELRWDVVEQRLLSSIADVAIPVHRGADALTSGFRTAQVRAETRGLRLPSPLVRVVGFAAAAAALALGVGSIAGSGAMPAASAKAHHRVEVASIAMESGSTHTRDLSALRAGDVVEAGDTPLQFGRAGLATWTMTPGSAVRVISTGDAVSGVGYSVALERGAIRAEVTPRDPSEGLVEAFAVEVGGTRVAVHGTAFSVKIEGDRAIVDVEHGAVAVGPVGHHGVTTGHLLVGPSRASFSLDGGRSARLLARQSRLLTANELETAEPVALEGSLTAASRPLAASPVRVAAADAPLTMGGDPPYPPAQPVVAPAVEPEAHSAPTAPALRAPAAHTSDKAEAHPAAVPPTTEAPPEPPRLSVASVQARLNRCARLNYGSSGSGDSTTTVVSTFSIDVNPDGSIRRILASPPLKPAMMGCVGASVSGLFPENTGHLDIPFSFQP